MYSRNFIFYDHIRGKYQKLTYSRRNNNVDLAGRIVLNEQKVETINFGKYRGRPVAEVLRRDPGYLSWIMQGDFSQNTKQTFMRIKLREGL